MFITSFSQFRDVHLVLHVAKFLTDVTSEVLLAEVAPERVVIVEPLAAKFAQGMSLERPVALIAARFV